MLKALSLCPAKVSFNNFLLCYFFIFIYLFIDDTDFIIILTKTERKTKNKKIKSDQKQRGIKLISFVYVSMIV